jgi:hypothetical protein
MGCALRQPSFQSIKTGFQRTTMDNNNSSFDYDYLVIDSGFGGSVSALRLSEKGYRVGVIETGR